MTRHNTISIFEHAVDLTSPALNSLPGMVTGKSSKSSSFHSLASDHDGLLADVANFEDIILGDDIELHTCHFVDQQFQTAPNLYNPKFLSELRTAPLKQASVLAPPFPAYRESSSARASRSPAARVQPRPPFPSLKKEVRNISLSTADGPAPKSKTIQSLTDSRCLRPTLAALARSPSPNLLPGTRDINQKMKPRRSSWQSNRERKSAIELELECDEDDGDDIPDGLVLSNVPISPRPPQERSTSQPPSKPLSPERSLKKDKAKTVGNGTPAVAAVQGSLRFPSWRSDSAAPPIGSASSSGASTPVNARAKSWTAALRDLSTEAKALTEKLEKHAGDLELQLQRSSTCGLLPLTRKSSEPGSKPCVKSALTELPPLRRTNVMIDPLPISREKEAVLSRTRPSWLPPKDPGEERRHLKEYQRMINQSLEADRRREAVKRIRSECRDTAADSLMHIWEEDILPRWNEAICERRTRELWWRGIAPRSRGAVWSLAIGNDLGLTEKSYEAALSRARDVQDKIKANMTNTISLDPRYVAWFNAIDKDIEEYTWTNLRIFQVGGPLHQSLVDVLHAYSMYRSDIGYISGCNTIAALLLINIPSPNDAFVILANLLNRPLPLSFYSCDLAAKASAYNLLMQTLNRKSPELHDHLVGLPYHDADFYLGNAITALFTTHIALDEVARLWDVYVFEGDSLIVQAGVAFLLENEMALLGTKTLEEVREVLNHESHGSHANKLLVGNGQEDRWMRTVRIVGRSQEP